MAVDSISIMDAGLLNSYGRIDEIGLLDNNWNDNGTAPFSKAILDSIRNIVSHLSVQPEIFPTARDSIQFEYENDNGDYLEFELFESGKLKMFLYKNSGESTTSYITSDKVSEAVNKFYGLERK